MKLEILICCYGNFPEISLPTIKKIIDLADDPKNLVIRVGMNECGKETTDGLRSLYDDGKIETLIECRSNRNKDPTMRVLIDHVEEPFFVWFDDDTYPVKKGWDTKTLEVIQKNEFDVAGFVHVTHRDTYSCYKEFLSKRPWFKSWKNFKVEDKNVLENAVFPHGAFWIAKTDFLRSNNFPDRQMIKKADDMLLGEMVFQQGAKMHNLDMWGTWIEVNKGPRRGTGESSFIPAKITNKFDGLTIYPTGGMCNRLRNVISAIILCRETNTTLRVLWENNSSQIASTDLLDYWELPSDVVYESITTDQIMEIHQKEEKNRFLRIPKEKLLGAFHNHWGLCCLEGEEVTQDRLIQGVKENVLPLNQRWQKIVGDFSDRLEVGNRNGLHIRAFEFLFGERKEEQLKMLIENFSKKFDSSGTFLATDSMVIQEHFVNRFGCKICNMIVDPFLSRKNRFDFEIGIIELYLLGKCKKVFGTKGSSFSQLAGIMSGNIEWIDGCREAKEWEG